MILLIHAIVVYNIPKGKGAPPVGHVPAFKIFAFKSFNSIWEHTENLNTLLDRLYVFGPTHLEF